MSLKMPIQVPKLLKDKPWLEALALLLGVAALAAPVAGGAHMARTLKLKEAVQKEIRRQLAQRMSLSESDFEVEIEAFEAKPPVDDYVGGELQVLGLGAQGSRRMDGLFSLSAAVPTASGRKDTQLTGVLKVTGPALVSVNTLNREHIIAAGDLRVQRLPWRSLPTAALGVGQKDVVGRRVRTVISAGDVVFPDLLDAPLAVRAGDSVELVVNAGSGVMIRSRAIARQAGRVGESIPVLQPDTNKLLNGALITGDRSVEVNL